MQLHLGFEPGGDRSRFERFVGYGQGGERRLAHHQPGDEQETEGDASGIQGRERGRFSLGLRRTAGELAIADKPAAALCENKMVRLDEAPPRVVAVPRISGR